MLIAWLMYNEFNFRSLKPFELVLEDDYLSCGPSEFNPSSCVICLKRVKDASLVCPQCNIPVCGLEVSWLGILAWNLEYKPLSTRNCINLEIVNSYYMYCMYICHTSYICENNSKSCNWYLWLTNNGEKECHCFVLFFLAESAWPVI